VAGTGGWSVRLRSRRFDVLEERLAALEAAVAERHHLDARVAELTDVVAELLVPLHQRDDRRVDEILARYRSADVIRTEPPSTPTA
jgi:hypothetical protein